ncbi:MAG: OsmC family protein [Acidobacteriota bacterium]
MAEIRLTAGEAFVVQVEARTHTFLVDEPAEAGGQDLGPAPYELLAAALGSCTSMTLRFYANREAIPLEGIVIRVIHDRKYARDCENCLSTDGYIHNFELELELKGNLLTRDQKEKLLEIAGRCPVNKTLSREIRIEERLVEPGTER